MRVEIGGLALDLTDAQVEDLRGQLGVVVVDESKRMLTTAQAAERLCVSEDYVRDHAAELGGVKLTDSPKAPWRFDPAKLVGSGESSGPDPAAIYRRIRRAPPRRAETGQLLKSRG